MFIRRLEISGFKSFKNKTVLEFKNYDITGVVGPNGCGKSNIVEALLWVMGESSPKSLRGESLSDIIFSGTNKEPSGNLAEVRLTLSKGDGEFPVDYKDFSEVMITRRSFRDGKNTCFINDKECLLRDIREFFMNTGAGCKGFSVIEQESIERLITAKPMQRRFIIEEVAGITKFKNQKDESTRRLQKVNQNLKRLDDVLQIQEGQLKHLNTQAKQAEKYKQLKQNIQLIEREIYSTHYNDLIESEKEIQVKIENEEKNQKKCEKTLLEKKDFALEISKNIKDYQKEKEGLQGELNVKNMESASLQDKAKTFEMIQSIKQKIQEEKEKQEKLKMELIGFEESFKEDFSLSAVQLEIVKVKDYLEDSRQREKSLVSHIEILKDQIQFIEKEIQTLHLEETKLKEKAEQNFNTKNEKKEFIKKEQSRQTFIQKKLSELDNKEQEFLNKKTEIEKQLLVLRSLVPALVHKIEEMKKLLGQFEQLNKGGNDLIQWKPEQFSPLFENLTVDPDYVPALSAVLGPWVQAVVPEDSGDLEVGIERLKQNKSGKSYFLSQLPQAENSISQDIKTYPSFICFLHEKVKWNLKNAGLKPFLEQTAVVSDLKSALDLKRQFPSLQFVTLEGDVVSQNSFVYAGSKDQDNGLLLIRSQIESSEKQLASKKIELKARELEWGSHLENIEKIQEEKAEQNKALLASSDHIKSAQKELDFISKDMLYLDEAKQKVIQKLVDFKKKQKNLLDHEALFLQDIDKQKEGVSLKSSYLKVLELALANQKAQSNLEKESALLLKVVNQSMSSAKTFSSLELEQEIEKNKKQKEDLEKKLTSVCSKLERSSETQDQNDKDIKSLEQSVFDTKLNVNKFLSEQEKKEFEKQHLKDKFMELHQMNIEDFKPSGDEPVETLKVKLSELEAKLNRIKEVNFLALEEYEKLSEDNNFLTKQKGDLIDSREGILKVINHIDKICKTRFHDMLEEVNKRFSKVFPIVFQGDNAKAELVLYKDPDSGEQGVNIMIHPPGKKPQSVSLLSRGEKALTSICLIYSLFLVKPSPFCIIDEADAPLDDANIFRFLSVLKEMSRRSQIIVITHNKYTMQNCHKLYGVTQNQPGISQIVSADMKAGVEESPRLS